MMPLSKSPASDGSVGAFFSDIYLTATTTQHLTWQLNIMVLGPGDLGHFGPGKKGHFSAH
jgi:hypothetical protein